MKRIIFSVLLAAIPFAFYNAAGNAAENTTESAAENTTESAAENTTESAAINYSFVCQHDKTLRSIEVVYLQEASLVPCEVRYHKDNDSKVLWDAKNQSGYCEAKAEDFKQKQEGWGWSCEKEGGAVTGVEKPDDAKPMEEASTDAMTE